ncbi:MAG: thioredoxin family protein [Oscillospiraceae bacterium]|nr:thioredoxin family protein [Oscillospiraceae bacterium]
MALFGKKKEEKAACGCNGGCDTGVKAVAGTSIKSIKVLGAGCKSCHEQYQNVLNAVAELGIATDVQYITDMEVVMGYGVMSMPAIVINEKVVAYGKVLKTKEVMELMK